MRYRGNKNTRHVWMKGQTNGQTRWMTAQKHNVGWQMHNEYNE